MPSDDRRGTLAGRLATTLAVAALVSAFTTTVAAMLLADALIVARVEGSVAAAARVMQVEIDEAPGVADHLEQEARTLGIDGRVAIVRDGSVVHGDAGLPPQSAVGCRVSEGAAVPELICGAPLKEPPGAMVLVATPAERRHEHRRALLLASLVVLVVVAAVARVVGGVLSRRSLVPLSHLRNAVARADPRSPAAIDLPAPTGLEEIDALRGALHSLVGRLDEELGRARRFAASAAHELRTPMAAKRAELELALEAPAPEADRMHTMERLARTTARLETLTERLLMLATPHDALVTDHCSSLAQLVEELPRRRSAEDGSRLRLEPGDADALVRGDEHLFAAVLDNLVDNALKFSDGPVRVSLSSERGEVVLEVSDEGPGIPPEFEAELFEPFHRGVTGRRRPGHGVGLALVRHIVRACGGQVSFVHGDVRGATVRVRLPGASSATAAPPVGS